MQFDLIEFVEELQQTANAQAYMDKCHKALESFGMESLCYVFIPSETERKVWGVARSSFIHTTHTPEWQNEFGSDLIIDLDLSTEAVVDNGETVLWHDASIWDDATQAERNKANIEREMGLYIGASLSLGSFQRDGFVSGVGLNLSEVSEKDFSSYWSAAEAPLTAICELLDMGIRENHGDLLVYLTPREKECLTLFAVGLNASEVAHKMKISERTLEKHIAHAKTKLRARTRDHAVVKALSLGVIKL